MSELAIAEAIEPILAPARYKGLYGGRGSSKSHGFATLAVICAKMGKRVVCLREIQRSINDSVKQLIEDKIFEAGLGAEFDIEAVDTAAGRTESGREYRAINPNGYVPTLETDDGDHLSEGVAILQYIADNNKERAFAPAPGTIQRARLQQFLNYAAAELHKAWGPLFADNSTEPEKQAAKTKVASKFDYLETILSDGRDYLVDNQFSAADAYTFVLINWANFKAINLSNWPRVSAYFERIANRPSTQSALVAEGLAR